MTDLELSTMHRTDPQQWARIIQASASAPDAAASAPSADEAVVTKKWLMGALRLMATNIAEQVLPLIGRTAALEQRLTGLEAAPGDKRGEEVNQALATRVAACETRTGALAMLLTKGPDASAKLSELENAIEKMKALETRLAELESRPRLKYCGTWDAATQYNEGEFCTHGGSVWHAKRSTRDRPGTSDAFVLAVKKGQDGKDAK